MILAKIIRGLKLGFKSIVFILHLKPFWMNSLSMDQLINTELMKIFEFAEEQDLFPDFVRLKRLSYRRSLFVIERLFNWYTMRISQVRERQVQPHQLLI